MLFRSGRASVVNLCSGEGISVADFSRAVARAMGAPEGLLGFGDVALRPDDVLHLVGSTRLLRNWSDWRPQLSIDAGIEEAIAGLEQRNG